jgi:hypothetical protein
MSDIDFNLANYRVGYELAKAEKELGKDWSIRPCSPLKLTPGKNYTAKGDALLFHNGNDVATLVNILFQPRDNTGINDWVPFEKEGTAEFYVGLGSDVDGEWHSGLTSLPCLEDPSKGELKSLSQYKTLNVPGKMFLSKINGDSDFPFSRFGFSFDLAKGRGSTQVVGFHPDLRMVAKPRHVNYQIGSFAFFANDCLYLDKLREKFG